MIDGKLNQEKKLNVDHTERLETIHSVYEQKKCMYDSHTHNVSIESLSEPPRCSPYCREKVGKPVEFSMKLDISVADGWTRLEYRSFDVYNAAAKLQQMIENFYRQEERYPSWVLADKIYRMKLSK